MNKRKLLVAAMLTLSLTVTTGVLAYDRYSAVWSDYGPMGTRCLAGVCANVEGGKLVDLQHWAGFEQPCGGLGAWVEKTPGHNEQNTTAWTDAECKYESGGIIYTDSTSYAEINV